MNVVDSSCWIDYFGGAVTSDFAETAINDTANLYVPSITIYEVYKKILLERTEHDALLAVTTMKQGKIINLDVELSLSAVKYSKDYKLPMADAIIYATARKYNCVLWTHDEHFEGLNSVNYSKKSV